MLTAAIMVTELTGDFAAIAPILIAAATANAVRHRLHPSTIYTEKLARRGLWVPMGLEPRSLRSVRARDLMRLGECPTESDDCRHRRVAADADLIELIVACDGRACVAVHDRRGETAGHITRTQIDVVRRALDAEA